MLLLITAHSQGKSGWAGVAITKDSIEYCPSSKAASLTRHAFFKGNMNRHLPCQPVGVEKCVLGRQLSQQGPPVKAWFCNQQKPSEITWPAQLTPESLQALSMREVEISRSRGPHRLFSKQWWLLQALVLLSTFQPIMRSNWNIRLGNSRHPFFLCSPNQNLATQYHDHHVIKQSCCYYHYYI